MYDVVVLTLDDGPAGADGCGCGEPPRAAVLACRDSLVAEGARVELAPTTSTEQIDAVVARLDGAPRPDGTARPAQDGPRLVVASAADGQIAAVVRRMIRRYAEPPGRRPADLPDHRTLPDLPSLGILPLSRSGHDDLAAVLGLPRDPAEVAKAVLSGTEQRLDLVRHDAGSVTLSGALLGGHGTWSARIDVDDAVLAEPGEQILACAIANTNGYARLDALPLAPTADPADGRLTVAVAVPLLRRRLLRGPDLRVEVRRAHGRAATVTPAGTSPVPALDDGVSTTLSSRRSWWIEPAAWGVWRTGSPRT